MTPAEFERAQWANFKKREQDHRTTVEAAWWTVALSRKKTLPSLTSLLTPARTLDGEEKKARQAEFDQLLAEMG